MATMSEPAFRVEELERLRSRVQCLETDLTSTRSEAARLRYQMEELEIQQIILENRMTGKLRPASPEQEAEIVEQMNRAVPLDLEGLIADLETRNPNYGA